MRKVLRWLGAGLGALVVLVGGFLVYVAVDGVPHGIARKVPDLHVEVTPARVARGRQLGDMLCVVCHQDPTTLKLTGKRMPDVPANLGVAYSRNITRDPLHGIGAWSDGDLAYLLRTGVARDGRYTPPWMVKFPHLADEDLASIIAWLRSDDPRLAASDAPDHDSQPTFLFKLLCHVAFRPLPYPSGPIAPPDPSDKIAVGRYYATAVLDCYACHSGDITKIDLFHPERSAGFLGGGTEMANAEGRPMRSANITFDDETGIGKWSAADFRRALRGGFAPGNRPILYPMERYGELSDADADAIYAYLATVPKLRHAVAPNAPPAAPPADAGEGAKIYAKYMCRSCHGASGVGTCDLRGADKKYPHDDALIAWIKNPQQLLPETKMPTWDGVIAEAEYAPLAAYVRELGRRADATASASAR